MDVLPNHGMTLIRRQIAPPRSVIRATSVATLPTRWSADADPLPHLRLGPRIQTPWTPVLFAPACQCTTRRFHGPHPVGSPLWPELLATRQDLLIRKTVRGVEPGRWPERAFSTAIAWRRVPCPTGLSGTAHQRRSSRGKARPSSAPAIRTRGADTYSPMRFNSAWKEGSPRSSLKIGSYFTSTTRLACSALALSRYAKACCLAPRPAYTMAME